MKHVHTQVKKTYEANNPTSPVSLQHDVSIDDSAQVISQTGLFIIRIKQLLSFTNYLVASLLFLRFIFALVGALNVGIVGLVRTLSEPFAAPFKLLSPVTSGFGPGVFDWSALVGLIVWYVIFYLIIALMDMLVPQETIVEDNL